MGKPAPLPPQLSYKSALCLIPPEDIWPLIQAIRSKHDKHYQRWPMPHINLIYPFLTPPADDLSSGATNPTTATRIEKSIQAISPLEITFTPENSFSHFLHTPNSATIWIGPSSAEELEKLKELQKLLCEQFASELGEEGKNGTVGREGDFVPHLSLGQANGAPGVRHLSSKFSKILFPPPNSKSKSASAPPPDSVSATSSKFEEVGQDNLIVFENGRITWKVDRLYVVNRKGFHDPFEVVAEIRFPA